MLKKPEIYDNVQLMEEFVPLSLGGHKGIIKNVEEYTSLITNNTSLKVEVDTDKNDKQPGYYQEQFDNNPNSTKKWSNAATKYVSLKEDENCVRMLKSFITAVENSNKGFTYDWDKDINQLNGKKVGLVFGIEEYQDNEGNVKNATKLVQFRSVDKADEVKIPRVKLLDGSYVDYEEYKNNKSSNNVLNELGDCVEISNEQLPF